MSTSLIDGFLIGSTCSRLPSLFIGGGEKLDGAVIDTSVADPACLSRILIFVPTGSLIPDPKTATKERGEKKLVVLPFFVATKITEFKIILFLNW
jgi:hypothetical protein